ncbi:hypothetical protein WN943_004202 [Citrus x changshan-huyou]
MSSWPLLIEARIPELGAIQGANLYSFIFQIVVQKFNPSGNDGTFNPAAPQGDSYYATIPYAKSWASPWDMPDKLMLFRSCLKLRLDSYLDPV